MFAGRVGDTISFPGEPTLTGSELSCCPNPLMWSRCGITHLQATHVVSVSGTQCSLEAGVPRQGILIAQPSRATMCAAAAHSKAFGLLNGDFPACDVMPPL